MKIEPIINEEFYALVAPDGSVQTTTLAPDEAMCMAVVKMLHKAGMGQSWHQLKLAGFTYQKVILTIEEGEVKHIQ